MAATILRTCNYTKEERLFDSEYKLYDLQPRPYQQGSNGKNCQSTNF
jgi:hypothetical protein